MVSAIRSMNAELLLASAPRAGQIWALVGGLENALTIKLSDRRWRAGLSVNGAFELPPRTERRSIVAVP
jgi:hypothetical protein